MPDSTTVSNPTNSARTVVGLMGIAVLFSLIGNEIEIYNAAGAGTKSPAKTTSGLDKGATIILGGLIAAGLLTALSGAGEVGRKFSVGLATVTAVTATLVYGGPVWSAVSKAVGGTPTTPSEAGAPTAASTPTSGTATAVALAQAA